MDLRKSFLKPFKKLKDKLPGDRRKRDGRSGGGNDGKGVEIGVEGSKASQRNSFMESEVDIRSMVGRGPSREGSNIDGGEAVPVDDLPTNMPSISRSGKSGGM